MPKEELKMGDKSPKNREKKKKKAEKNKAVDRAVVQAASVTDAISVKKSK
jgi:hypothetical protein